MKVSRKEFGREFEQVNASWSYEFAEVSKKVKS